MTTLRTRVQALAGGLGRVLPLGCYAPFRRGVVTLRRGSLRRNLCVAVLKLAERTHHGQLFDRLDAVRPLDTPGLSFAATDSMVMESVFWFGVQGYEGQVTALWTSLCATAGQVLEVGGNVGLFTTLGAAACPGRYTVVEPVPEVAAVLRANLARNGIANVRVLEAAAVPGDADREVSLSVPDERRDAPVGAHLLDGVEVSGRTSQRVIRVAGAAFNRLLQGTDLVKIDAEGIEAELLAASRDYIVAHRPTLLVEVLPEATRLGAMLAELAAAAGYTIHVVPEYGDPQIVEVPPGAFTAALPQRHRSKDVVLIVGGLPTLSR